MNVELFRQRFEAIRAETQKVLLGQQEIIEHVLVALFAGGHVLLEGVPGLGKTLLVRSLSHVLGVAHKRIQFTPDLMPSDVTGGNVFNQKEDAFVFMPGPVFTQLLLADEINRAPAKTQSALLEAMQERSVSADGVTRALAEPFVVIATQNPIESQGTYPLPEAQLDRFLVKVFVRHPDREIEQQLLRYYRQGFNPNHLAEAGLTAVTNGQEILAMRDSLRDVGVDDQIIFYITEIVGRTRSHRAVYLGASPRASIALLTGARARAASRGRAYVTPDDIKALAPAVLRHRVVLHPDAEMEGVSADDCVNDILQSVAVPHTAAG
jgi:MoxR-like ATPase